MLGLITVGCYIVKQQTGELIVYDNCNNVVFSGTYAELVDKFEHIINSHNTHQAKDSASAICERISADNIQYKYNKQKCFISRFEYEHRLNIEYRKVLEILLKLINMDTNDTVGLYSGLFDDTELTDVESRILRVVMLRYGYYIKHGHDDIYSIYDKYNTYITNGTLQEIVKLFIIEVADKEFNENVILIALDKQSVYNTYVPIHTPAYTHTHTCHTYTSHTHIPIHAYQHTNTHTYQYTHT